ncbi:uncharacterized protein CMU_033130 [Cryptosporidium muris RN66]|uniref:FPL domain-containing protein n=1 Tax=Cryptosporidium muris (strain RN66) TaxID=441375 RepID=B6AFD7_CRYMR|nr:uncharacterized protein CMU_033130 [Cryptosporidium muris RN66]EEA06928.1 hypothetical protein, conserved [Cryptosporidium muris RN66]|eukprot:XP_002141277.1 hypothetical protein [Cryptosporidium muris RN66]
MVQSFRSIFKYYYNEAAPVFTNSLNMGFLNRSNETNGNKVNYTFENFNFICAIIFDYTFRVLDNKYKVDERDDQEFSTYVKQDCIESNKESIDYNLIYKSLSISLENLEIHNNLNNDKYICYTICDVVEYIRSVAEILLWGDQNNEEGYFEVFCRYNILHKLVEIAVNSVFEYACRRQSLQTISILLQNIKTKQTLYYFLSNNTVIRLLDEMYPVSQPYEYSNICLNEVQIIDEEEELLSYYVTLLRTMALLLNNETARFFYNDATNKFSLWIKACKYVNHKDPMIRNTSRTVILNILRTRDEFILNCIILHEYKYISTSIRHELLNIKDQLSIPNISNCNDQDKEASLLQALVSMLLRHIYILDEHICSEEFAWPSINSLTFKHEFQEWKKETNSPKISNINNWKNQINKPCNNFEESIFENRIKKGKFMFNTQNISRVSSPISPISSQLSPQSSPQILNLSSDYHDYFMKPLTDNLYFIEDILEFIDDILSLGIRKVSELIELVITHQIFEMVLFQGIFKGKQNILIKDKVTFQIKNLNIDVSYRTSIYIFYKFTIFFNMNNNENRYFVFQYLIWTKLIDAGNLDLDNKVENNTMINLINNASDDTEISIVSGIIDLYSSWIYSKNAICENSPLLAENEKNSRVKLNTIQVPIESSLLSNLWNTLKNISNYIVPKESSNQNIWDELKQNQHFKSHSLLEFQLSSDNIRYLERSNYIQNKKRECFLRTKRCKSLPRGWRLFNRNKQILNDKKYFLKQSEHCSDFLPYIGTKKIKNEIVQIQEQLKSTFPDQVSKVSKLIASQILIEKHQNIKDCGDYDSKFDNLDNYKTSLYRLEPINLNDHRLLLLVSLPKLLEKMMNLYECTNNNSTLRPICLLAISGFICSILRESNSEYYKCKEHLEVFIRHFLNFVYATTINIIFEIIQKGRNKEDYSYNQLSGVNYMICENMVEWYEEDAQTIRTLLLNSGDSCSLLHYFLISPYNLPKSKHIHEPLEDTTRSKRYIWNLIDGYPILRWYPNTGNCFNFTSVFIDQLRTRCINLHIIESLYYEFNRIFISEVEADLLNNINSINDSNDLANINISNNLHESQDCYVINSDHEKIGFRNKKIILRNSHIRHLIKIESEHRPMSVLIIRTSKKNNLEFHPPIYCYVIFDNFINELLFIIPNIGKCEAAIVAQFPYIKCRPVRVFQQSSRISSRYLVALLIRCETKDIDFMTRIKDIMYQLPLREDLSNCSRMSNGAIIHPKETNYNNTIYHLNNIILPKYTRAQLPNHIYNISSHRYNDYAVYIEFSCQKKSQLFTKYLNVVRQKNLQNKLHKIYHKLYKKLYDNFDK